MSNNPFSLDRSGGLDMFGSSALSSGLGLDVTAFGGFDAIAANDDDPDPPPSSPSSSSIVEIGGFSPRELPEVRTRASLSRH